jgi:hypothetical protein
MHSFINLVAAVGAIGGVAAQDFNPLQHLGGNGQWFPGTSTRCIVTFKLCIDHLQVHKSLASLLMYLLAAKSSFLLSSLDTAVVTLTLARTMDGLTSRSVSKHRHSP